MVERARTEVLGLALIVVGVVAGVCFGLWAPEGGSMLAAGATLGAGLAIVRAA